MKDLKEFSMADLEALRKNVKKKYDATALIFYGSLLDSVETEINDRINAIIN